MDDSITNGFSRKHRDFEINDKDFQWAFGLNRLSLNLIGVWPNFKDKEVQRCSSNFKNLRIPFMVVWLIVGLFLPQMYALSQVYRELPLVIDNLTTSCAALTSSIKLFLMWNNRKVLYPMVKSIINDWSRVKTPQERKVMIKQAQRARTFTISGYAIMFVCFVGFIATPFFGLSIRIINNLTDPVENRFFPLQTYYPYESTESPYFELTYLSQLIAGSFVGIAFSVPDNFFGALVFHASGQCEILGLEWKSMLPVKNDKVEKKLFRNNLRRLVDVHVNLIRFVDFVEHSFNVLILAQVLCLYLIICCLGFAVIRSVGIESERPPFVQIATLVGTLLNLMIHMLVYCIASEILTEHSLGFFHAVYCCNWYYLKGNHSRDITLIMLRSKHPMKLSAGKFFTLSLNAYLKILKSSAGYISMLLAVSNF